MHCRRFAYRRQNALLYFERPSISQLQSWTLAARRRTTNRNKEDDRKDGARMPARVGRRDEDAEKDTEKDGEEGAKRSRAGAGAPPPRPGVGRHEAGARGDELCRDGGASSWPWCRLDRVYERMRGRASRPRRRRRPPRARSTSRSTPWIITRPPSPPSRRLRAVSEPVTLAFPATPRAAYARRRERGRRWRTGCACPARQAKWRFYVYVVLRKM